VGAALGLKRKGEEEAKKRKKKGGEEEEEEKEEIEEEMEKGRKGERFGRDRMKINNRNGPERMEPSRFSR